MLVSLTAITVITTVCPSTGETVHVTNNLTSSNLVLIVHCRSGDDNIHAHAVPFGAEIEWSFSIDFTSTLFWCNLAVQDKRIHFDAYDDELDHGRSFALYWVANDDGVRKFYSNNRRQISFVPWN
ncbi:S-protein homolog 29 [Linum grandiflorum]